MGTWEHLVISSESHFVYFLILNYYGNMTSINDLQNDPKNARKRTDRSAKLIKQSLEQYGAARSIVIDENNRILAGNGTIAGAKAAGIKNLKIIESNGDEIIAVKRTGLSEEEKVGLAIADNRTGDLSEWDIDMLEQLSKEHDLNDFFDKKELDDILSKKEVIPTEGLTDPDDVPEVPEEPITKEGDLYILGNHRLLCGDSTNIQHVEKLMDNKKADMVFTDPPYGMSYGGGRAKGDHVFGKNGGVSIKAHGMIKNDNLQGEKLINLVRDALNSSLNFTKKGAAAYICFTWRTYNEFETALRDAGLSISNCIVWNKKSIGLGMSNYRPQHEFIFYSKGDVWYGDKSQSDIWEMSRGATGKYVHPTQKPIELIERAIINSTKTEDTLIDIFGGSGSTLIASERLKRNACLIELDPKYCDVIVKRWEDFTGKTAKRVSSS